jgi:phosphoglycerate dehydrogenase-like enzyme
MLIGMSPIGTNPCCRFRSPAEFAREVGNAHAIIGGITKEDFPAAKKLKWVQTISAGVEATLSGLSS